MLATDFYPEEDEMPEPNEPPKTIYLQWHHSDPSFGVTWCDHAVNDDDVAYALIEPQPTLDEDD